MRDRKISLDSAIGGWAWGLALCMILAMWATGDTRWGHTAMLMTAIGVTATVRAFVVAQCVSLRNAFDIGRDSASLTPIQRR